MPSNGQTDPGSSSRQLLVVAISALGLVVAAFAMPATAPQLSPPSLDLSGESDCTIQLSEEPVPGQTVTAEIRYQGEPVRDSPVWFNGQFVGRTDAGGQVVGTVPYEKRLRIRVELPRGGRCRAGSGTGGQVRAPDSIGGSGSSLGAVERSPASLGPGSHSLGPAAATGPQAQQQPENGSGEYVVRGRIDVAVDRQPYPGETTQIRATIRGNPVQDATVTVDGRTVGRTDESGNATIRAPDEGDGTIRVAVERGEFRSERRVTVRRLDAGVRPDGPLPLPGGDATVVARLGDRPAENATVTLGGERLGRTGGDGTVGMTIPADPTAQVRVATPDQTATYPVVLVFAPTALFGLLFSVVTFGIPAAGYAASGRRGLVGGLIAVGIVYALATGYILGDGTGLLAAVAMVVVTVAIVTFVRSDHDATGSLDAFATSVGRLGDRLFSDTLWLTGRIEATVDGLDLRLRSLRARMGSLTLATAGAWLTGLPWRLLAALRAVLGAPRRLFDGSEGSVDPTPSEPAERSPDDPRTPRARFRRIWRRFASQVVPTEWPRRTAGEVSRRAIERGMPSEPVEQLTDTFRDVEYGDRSLTERQVERASAALSALTDEEEEEGSS